jgi:hypothetical protein
MALASNDSDNSFYTLLTPFGMKPLPESSCEVLKHWLINHRGILLKELSKRLQFSDLYTPEAKEILKAIVQLGDPIAVRILLPCVTAGRDVVMKKHQSGPKGYETIIFYPQTAHNWQDCQWAKDLLKKFLRKYPSTIDESDLIAVTKLEGLAYWKTTWDEEAGGPRAIERFDMGNTDIHELAEGEIFRRSEQKNENS